MEDRATIIVNVQLNPKDLCDLWRGSAITFLRLLLVPCGAYLSTIIVGEIVNQGFSVATDYAIAYYGVGALAAFFTAIFFPRLRAWQLIRHGPTLRERRRYSFSDRDVHFDSELMTCDLRWDSFSRIVESRRSFILYLAPLYGMVIPKRYLTNPDDLQRLRELFRNQFKGKLKLRS
jgi:YcxB-like protein